jgi:hypothetical protein
MEKWRLLLEVFVSQLCSKEFGAELIAQKVQRAIPSLRQGTNNKFMGD